MAEPYRPLIPQRKKLYLLGDSITQWSFDTQYRGWGAALQHHYQRSVDVINRGFSGYNSRWVLQMLPTMMPTMDSHCEVVVIFLGANDSAMSETPSQYVPIIEYVDNMKAIIHHCQAMNPKASIVLVTPPTVDNALWPDRSEKVVSRYAQAVRNIVAEQLVNCSTTVHLLDLWQDDATSQGIATADLFDGLHFGEGGNHKMFTKLQALIDEKCPHLVVAEEPAWPTLSQHFPHWSELAGKPAAETEQILQDWTW
jgi:isoamyl acetate esterase